MELSTAQKKIVEAKENKIVVVASAAAGKTTVLTQRVRYLLSHGADPTKVVMITFTNAAAEEMAERLGHPKGIFIGTIHSYANYPTPTRIPTTLTAASLYSCSCLWQSSAE